MEMFVYYSRGEEEGGGGLWRCLYIIPGVRRGGGVMEMFV